MQGKIFFIDLKCYLPSMQKMTLYIFLNKEILFLFLFTNVLETK